MISKFILFPFFRSPSRDSVDKKPHSTDDGKKDYRVACSDIERIAYEGDLDEDNFLAHLETELNNEESFYPKK